MIGSGFDRRDSGSEGQGSSGGKVRVYELAKEFGLAPKDLVPKLRAMGVDVANHMSAVDTADADRIRRSVERERQESLVETRLNDTVIRRRSRLPGPGPSGPARLRVDLPAAKPSESAAPSMAVETPPVEPRRVFVVPEPEPAPVVDEPPSLPEPEPVLEAAPDAPEPIVPPETPGPEPVREATQKLAPEPSPSASPIQEPKPSSSLGPVIKIPQPVVTGSAATGQFIQLPGMPGRDGTVPKIEIKDRDEELRRLGRSGLVSRGPGGRDWRQPGAAPGQRPVPDRRAGSGLMDWMSGAVQDRIQDHKRSEAVPQIKIHGVALFGDQPEIFSDRQLAYDGPLDPLGAGGPTGAVMFVILGILLVDLKIVLRDIHYLCSEKHVPDPH